MMKLKNPLFVSPNQSYIDSVKVPLKAYLDANQNDEFITFDKIRADNPDHAEKLNDGVLHEIMNFYGIEVIEE